MLGKTYRQNKIMKNIQRYAAEQLTFLSLLSDSNQRPRDYKSRALAN